MRTMRTLNSRRKLTLGVTDYSLNQIPGPAETDLRCDTVRNGRQHGAVATTPNATLINIIIISIITNPNPIIIITISVLPYINLWQVIWRRVCSFRSPSCCESSSPELCGNNDQTHRHSPSFSYLFPFFFPLFLHLPPSGYHDTVFAWLDCGWSEIFGCSKHYFELPSFVVVVVVLLFSLLLYPLSFWHFRTPPPSEIVGASSCG